MELSYSYLRTKEVVNTVDGKRLGKISDVVLLYPENRVCGFVVPGAKGLFCKKNERFFDIKDIVKIGKDVILVRSCAVSENVASENGRGESTACAYSPPDRRSFEEYE